MPRAGCIHAVAVEISRVGNNVNQLSHIANENHALPSANALAEAMALIKASLEKVLAL
jgi:hypothetical protein